MKKTLFATIVLFSLFFGSSSVHGLTVNTTCAGETITWDLDFLTAGDLNFIGCWPIAGQVYTCQYVAPVPNPFTLFTLEAKIDPTVLSPVYTALLLGYVPYGDTVFIRDCPHLQISAEAIFSLVDPIPPNSMQKVLAITFERYESVTIMIEIWFRNPGSTTYYSDTSGRGTPATSRSPGGIFFIGSRPSPGPGKSKPHWRNVGGGPGKCGKLGLPKHWVNTSDLNLAIEDTDFAYKGLGPGVSLKRTYNSQNQGSGMFGNGWTFAYESTIDNKCEGALLSKGSGASLFYKASNLCYKTPPVTTTPPESNFDALTLKAGDFWILQTKSDHHEWRYDFLGEFPSGFSQSVRRYRLSSVKDTSGNTLTVAYNADGTIDSLTDAVGRITRFSYDGNKHCTLVTLPNGKTAAYTYDAKGNLISTKDFAGTVTTYSYDADNYLVSITSGGRSWTFTYTTTVPKQIKTATDALGNVTTYSKSEATVTVTNPRGGQSTYTSSGHFLARSTNELGLDVHRFTYSEGQAVEFKDTLGRTTQWGYDSRGNMTSRTGPKSDLTAFSYDLSDNLTAINNTYGQNWQLEYDDSRHLIQTTTPLGHIAHMTYASNGLLTGLTDAKGGHTSYTYDAFGNPQTIIDPLGNQTQFTYDSAGFDKASTTNGRGFTWQYSYDNNRRLTQVTNPDGTTRKFLYDCCSATGLTDENGHTTTFQTNAESLTVAINDPLGGVTAYTYTDDKLLETVTDPLNRVTFFSYDAAGRLVGKTDPLSGTTRRSYDGNGNLASVTDEKGKTTQFFYDANNRLEQTTDPLGRSVYFDRDLLGRITTVFNARFQVPTTGVIQFAFDADGRKISKTYPPTVVATYQYDATDKLTGFSDATGLTTYTRNALGRVTNILYPNGLSLSKSYDAAGNLSSVGYPNGLTVSYTYDGRNRVTRVAWGSNWLNNSYDSGENIVSQTRSNGTVSSYVHDANNKIISISHAKGAVAFAQMTYTRNANGDVIGESRSLPLAVSVPARQQTCTYDDANQLISCSSDTYTYDLDGNLTKITGSRTFNGTYDPENRLTAATVNGTASTYIYGATGARIRAVKGATTRNYHYDETGRLFYETNGSNQVTTCYIYNGDHLAAMFTSGGATYMYHFDQIGSTVAITNSSGNVEMAYVYSPFGEVVGQMGSLYNPFTFVGELGVMDEGNGLFFMKNRYYDAITGRFLQKDPIGIEGGLNLYAYVDSNPVSWNDPKGYQARGGSRRYYATGDGQLVPNDPNIYPQKDFKMPRSDEEIRKANEAGLYMLDKTIGSTPVVGIGYGLCKAGYYCYTGDQKQAKKELTKTALDPLCVGIVLDIADDLGLWDGDTSDVPDPGSFGDIEPESESYHDVEIYE